MLKEVWIVFEEYPALGGWSEGRRNTNNWCCKGRRSESGKEREWDGMKVHSYLGFMGV